MTVSLFVPNHAETPPKLREKIHDENEKKNKIKGGKLVPQETYT
jgi:hypothetical protein